MPFKFAHVCDLFEQLEDLSTGDPPLLPSRLQAVYQKTIERWFGAHRRRIDACDTSDVALLSALFPERRTDRVYGFREKGLIKLLGRVLGLPIARYKVLLSWDQPGNGDLGACVERIQRQAVNTSHSSVLSLSLNSPC